MMNLSRDLSSTRHAVDLLWKNEDRAKQTSIIDPIITNNKGRVIG